MYKTLLFSVFLLGVFGLFSVAHAEPAPQVGFAPSGVWFSKEPFFAGEEVRVFTFLVNCSDTKVEGTVSFLDGETEIATRPFSLRGDCDTAVISTPWEVAEGEHTVSAHISRAVRADTEEDVVLSREALGAVTRVAHKDTDRDGVPDNEDSDIDGDGIPNDEEIALETNPREKDTDGDGIPDGEDDNPLVESTTTPEAITASIADTVKKVAPSASTTKSTVQKARNTLETFRKENAERFADASASFAEKRAQKQKETEDKKEAEDEVPVDTQITGPQLLDSAQNGLLAGAQFASNGLAHLFSIRALFYVVLALVVFFVTRRIYRRLRALVRGRPEEE